jgi:hypothetical protein
MDRGSLFFINEPCVSVSRDYHFLTWCDNRSVSASLAISGWRRSITAQLVALNPRAKDISYSSNHGESGSIRIGADGQTILTRTDLLVELLN